MKNIKSWVQAVFLAFFLLANQGCFALFLGAAAGVGGVTYVKGKLEKNLDYSVKQVHSAALSALKSMKLFIIDDDVGEHEAVVKFEYDDGEKGQVSVKALTEKACTVVIRIGILGDQLKSQSILTAIENKL